MVPPECEKYLERAEHMFYCEQTDKDSLLNGFQQGIFEMFSDTSGNMI